MDNSLISSDVLNASDLISKLPNDVLVKILSRLSTEESVRTSVLSTRWVHVWKKVPNLYLDTRRIRMTTTLLYDVGRSMTKVINEHPVDLERCTIHHHSFQLDAGMIETWLQTLVHVKHVKHLALFNELASITLILAPDSFSHPSLESVVLSGYTLKAPHSFNRSCNLKQLNLIGVLADVEFFNKMLVACTSLEAVLLQIDCLKINGPLKIGNRKLKFVLLACYNVDKIELSTLSVDILVVETLSCARENLVIANPKLHFYRNYWATGPHFPRTSYNISCPPQGEKSIAHTFMMSRSADCMKRFGSMSVRVDLMNTKEMNMLKEVLVAWPGEMQELEIVFKNNNALGEEGESSMVGTQNMYLEERKPFPNASFRVFFVWFSNFSGSAEEIAFASGFIMHGSVVRTMLIKPLEYCSSSKKLEIEAAVAHLKALPKARKEFSIMYS